LIQEGVNEAITAKKIRFAFAANRAAHISMFPDQAPYDPQVKVNSGVLEI